MKETGKIRTEGMYIFLLHNPHKHDYVTFVNIYTASLVSAEPAFYLQSRLQFHN